MRCSLLAVKLPYLCLRRLKLVEFSCHDANILALASLLGVDIAAPFFAGHWLFELHKSTNGQWSVHAIYNSDPTAMPPEEFLRQKCWQLPLDGKYLGLEECNEGSIPADTFLNYIDTHSGMGNTAETANGLRAAVSALREAHRGDTQATKNPIVTSTAVDNLAQIFDKLKGQKVDHADLTQPGPRREQLAMAFDAADANHSGQISMAELATLLRRMGATAVTIAEAEQLVECFDQGNEGHGPHLSFEEYVAMVAALEKFGQNAE